MSVRHIQDECYVDENDQLVFPNAIKDSPDVVAFKAKVKWVREQVEQARPTPNIDEDFASLVDAISRLDASIGAPGKSKKPQPHDDLLGYPDKASYQNALIAARRKARFEAWAIVEKQSN